MMYVNSTSPAPLCISPDTGYGYRVSQKLSSTLKIQQQIFLFNKNERYVETPADVACVL